MNKIMIRKGFKQDLLVTEIKLLCCSSLDQAVVCILCIVQSYPTKYPAGTTKLEGSSTYPSKELSLCHNLKFCNLFIFASGWCELLIFQTSISWSNRVHSLKYHRSRKTDCKDIWIRKHFVTKTQFLLKLSQWIWRLALSHTKVLTWDSISIKLPEQQYGQM